MDENAADQDVRAIKGRVQVQVAARVQVGLRVRAEYSIVQGVQECWESLGRTVRCSCLPVLR